MILLTSTQRLQLINAAPSTHADHLVGADATGYAVVRVDALGRRIVALGATPEEALARAKPIAAPPSAASAQSATQNGTRRSKTAPEARKIDADVFAAELAEYRRAVAAVGAESKLL